MNRRAVARTDDNLRNLLRIFDPAGGADEITFALVLDVTRADGNVVSLHRVDHVGEGEAVTDELHWVGLHVILLDVTADRIHARDVLHAFQLRANDPILNGPQVSGAFDVG